jgi:hypothetical protein
MKQGLRGGTWQTANTGGSTQGIPPWLKRLQPIQGNTMTTRTFIKTLTLCIAITGASASMAQDLQKTQDMTQTMDQQRDQDRIYSYEHMTDQERAAYRERMRLAKTEQEREQIRAEHREKMDLRMRSQNQNKPVPSGNGMGKNPGGNAPIIPPKSGSGRN